MQLVPANMAGRSLAVRRGLWADPFEEDEGRAGRVRRNGKSSDTGDVRGWAMNHAAGSSDAGRAGVHVIHADIAHPGWWRACSVLGDGHQTADLRRSRGENGVRGTGHSGVGRGPTNDLSIERLGSFGVRGHQVVPDKCSVGRRHRGDSFFYCRVDGNDWGWGMGGNLTTYVDINIIRVMSRVASVPYETTLLVRDCCLCLHVQRAARSLARRFDEELRELGLTNGQFSLLMSLNRPKPPGMGSVASLLAMDRTTLTAALKPLERRGMVQVSPDPDDRRSRLLSLTPKGKKLLADGVPIWERVHREVESMLPEGDPERLRSNLRALA